MSGKYQKLLFYECVRKTLFPGRLAGFIPISGLMGNHCQFLRNVWVYLYYMVSLTIITSGAGVHIYDFLYTGRRFKDLGGLVKQSYSTIALLFLLKFALSWKNLLKKVEENEKLLPPFKNHKHVIKTINQYMMCLFVFGVANYLIYLAFTIRIISICNKETNEMSFQTYFTTYYAWYFEYVSYNWATAVLLQLTILQTSFLYHFVDALIVVVSLYLVYRFRNFNRLMRLKQKACIRNNHTNWSDLQAHYTRLARLVKIIDDHINPLVFLSFLSSLIFICKMIYDIIQKHKDILNNVHNPNCIISNRSDWVSVLNTFISFVYLLFKTTSVSVISSHLHFLSQEPLNTLHTLPASAYNLEMQRFMDQVYYSRVNLTGLQFFYVTRGTILSMLSTIITYELVLLQLPAIYK